MVVISGLTKRKKPVIDPFLLFEVMEFEPVKADTFSRRVIGYVFMPVWEKVKRIRRAIDMTQAELGEIILSSASKVSRVEGDQDQYTEEDLNLIRKHFNLIGMPLSELECVAFMGRLYLWRDLIRDQRMEAKIMQPTLVNILNLCPCDDYLPTLYRLFEVLLLIDEGELCKAEENLTFFQRPKIKLCNEHIYYYYYCVGRLSGARKEWKKALEYFVQALNIIEDKEIFLFDEDAERLYYNIALCYSHLESVSKAMLVLIKTKEKFIGKETDMRSIYLDNMLASNYITIGELKEARKLLDSSLLRAKSINDNSLMCLTLYNLGFLYKQSKEYNKAIEYFDQAISIFKIGSNDSLWSCYNKIYCQIELREFVKAENEIKQAKKLYTNNQENLIYFESLEHILTIKRRMTNHNDASTKYIEGTTIPYLIKNCYKTEAVNYYKLLEYHYKKTKKIMKSLNMAKAILDIKEQMYEGDLKL